ncbi:alpha/beta hydrolase-fold protein [Hymenobacter sublimis]|uniref:Alpha/beta hydrolase-fold protein n=1 Tax=Hymenobacter sublimis TaxID=2933777 RepID=A0ABY4JC80_9BACT|nr:alpha/beta hydrolase-fold protein [Hymenobacter sublimis]UPL50424.1 alpha/beta hydrolase-fold protein [Hymenobacter sublimis]
MRLSLVILLLSVLFRHAGLAQTTLRIAQVPAATPAGAALYLAGSCNSWQPASAAYRFTSNPDGSYQLVLPASVKGAFAYKITRGSWETVETDARNQDIENRVCTPGDKDGELQLTVHNWKDLSAAGASRCQSTALQPNVQVISTSFPMPQLGRTRRVWMYLPSDYASAPTKRYPVLYMHDGQNVFDACTSFSGEWGIDETLSQLQQQGLDATGCLVVAVDNGGSERLNELSPWKNPEYGGGQGNEYVDFLARTLKPYIDANYRTLSGREFTGIAGSSMGGLISTYAALKYPQVYSKVGVFSPAFWFAKDSLFAYLRPRRPQPNTQFYFVSGTTESETMVPLMKAVHDTLARAGAGVQYTTPADGKHTEWFWKREFPAAYRWLYQPDATMQQRRNRGPLPYGAYLNAEQNQLIVHLPSGRGKGQVAILNQQKQTVLRKHVKGGSAVDVSRLPAGSYEVLVRVKDQVGRQLLVKQ